MNRIAAFTALGVCGLLMTLPYGRAASDRDDDRGGSRESRKIEIGFEIAPVPLHLFGRSRDLVGLGSYIVNAVADCNGCHSAGPATAYVGNPYLFAPPSLTVHQTKKVNPATYLGGGQDFGPYPAPNSPLHIVSRNLTPGVNGKPGGDLSFPEFKVILRTGRDFDKLHPTCPADSPQTDSCVPYPFDGHLLQIMPWPAFQDMTDHDLEAIYEYLSAIPCIDTVIEGQPQLSHDCPVRRRDR
jgi:hypothetical protein